MDGLALSSLVAAVAGSATWLVANWAYVDFCRRGERGFKRLAAFWIGFPATLISLYVVEEGSQPTMRADDDDLEELFREVRQDRRLRDRSDPG